MHKAGGKKFRGLTNQQFEALVAGRKLSSISRLWRGFWQHADQVRGHYLWRGPVKRGRPVFVPEQGPELPASHVAWIYDQLELRAGEYLRPACGRAACIRPDHQEVVRGGR